MEEKMLTIIYDSKCQFCNRCRNFVEKRAGAACHFVDNTSEEAKLLCRSIGIQKVPTDTIVTIDGFGGHHQRFAACRAIARTMGRKGHLLSRILWLIPRPIGDWGYDVVSKNRPLFSHIMFK